MNRNNSIFLVNKYDLFETTFSEEKIPISKENEVILEIERYAFTSNNITYGVIGDTLGYWNFFPAEEPYGIIPVWGFANVTSSKNEYIFYLDGPAEKIFKNNIDNKLINEFANCEIGKFIELSDLIITGTSWQSSIERRFIKSAKLHGKKVISILDHWVNYRERFITEGDLILPDEIWVCDEYAKKIAEDKFKNISLKLIENPYIENLKKNITSYMKLNSNLKTENILYVCEPIKDHAKIQFGDENYHGYTEESALKYFLKQIDLLNIDYKNIIIRPHPSENIKKYN